MPPIMPMDRRFEVLREWFDDKGLLPSYIATRCGLRKVHIAVVVKNKEDGFDTGVHATMTFTLRELHRREWRTPLLAKAHKLILEGEGAIR